MLNPFYWYSIIWLIVIALYGLGFSAINTPLEFDLQVFFCISIIVSFFLGFILRKIFIYRPLQKKVRINNTLTNIIVIVSLGELIYARQIPLISIARGQSEYGDFMGIPLIHTLLINFIILYSTYLFYIFLETHEKAILNKIILQLLPVLLMFQKGVLILCIFIFVNMIIAKLRINYRVFSLKNIIIICLVLFLVLYINGILANIRSGFSWNDSSSIYETALITHWPKFIPQQLIWTYTYITTPLGNLNQILNNFSGNIHCDQLITSILPVTFVKQFTPVATDNVVYSILLVPAMNACTGYQSVALGGGMTGIWFLTIMIDIIIFFFSIWLQKKRYRTPMYGILCMMTTFLFFYDTFSTAQTSLLILMIWLFYKMPKVRF